MNAVDRQSTPAVNAPGGLALAGYKHCHVIPIPYSFLCVSHASDAANDLIDKMYINQVAHLQLQRGGALAMIKMTSAHL